MSANSDIILYEYIKDICIVAFLRDICRDTNQRTLDYLELPANGR